MEGSGLEAIRERLRALLPELRERYAVRALWVFGSRARGDAHEGSDVDLLVDFSRRDYSLWDFIGLEQEIEDRIGLKVDLVDKAALRPEIRPYILPEAVPV